MDSSDDEQMNSGLLDKIHQMSLEIDSLKASRNYYKDQCETLYVSLSKTMTEKTPSYRTQKEVEELISNIKAQEAEKNKILKQRYKDREKIFQAEITKLQETISHHESIIENQKNVRTELIEQLMSYKKRVNAAESKIKDAENTIDQLKSSTSSSITVSSTNINQTTNSSEINMLKKKILKYAKQLEEMKNSITLTNSLQEDAVDENKKMKKTIEEQTHEIESLRKQITIQTQQVNDSKSLLSNAIREAELLQSDVESAQSTIDILVKRLSDKEAEFNSYTQEIANRITEIRNQKTALASGNTTIINLQTQNQTFIKQITELKQTIEINQTNYQTQVQMLNSQILSLKSTIDSQNSQIQELNNQNQQNQTELLSERRLRKAAEVAKEAAVTNLKNAYALLAANENSRNESTAEFDRITVEMTNKNKELDEREGEIARLTESLKETTEKLNESINSEKNLRQKLEEVNAKYVEMQQHSILRDEAQKAIDAVANERDKAIEIRQKFEAENSSIVSELNDIRIAFNHQEETIAALQTEVKSLAKANSVLRNKLLNGEELSEINENNEISHVTSSKLLENQEEIGKSVIISEIRSQLDISQKQTIKDQNTIKILKQDIDATKNAINDFVESLLEFSNYVPTIAESHQRLKAKLQKIQDIPVSMKLISQFIVDAFDECVRYSKAITDSTEGTLLRSSISHLTRKIDTLQQQNAAQADDINTLQSNIQTVYSNKEKVEDELQSFTKTITSLRVTLDATKRKLADSEVEKKKLKQELSVVPPPKPQNDIESSFSDSLNLSEISSFSDDEKQTKSKSKSMDNTTALGDSLAMLDLICQ